MRLRIRTLIAWRIRSKTGARSHYHQYGGKVFGQHALCVMVGFGTDAHLNRRTRRGMAGRCQVWPLPAVTMEG